MKQATILICAFLVLFQVCSTVCDDTDTATNADANTATVRVSDLYSSAGPLNDLSSRWFQYSSHEDISTSDDIETMEIGDSVLEPCHTIDENSPKELVNQCFLYFLFYRQAFPEYTLD